MSDNHDQYIALVLLARLDHRTEAQLTVAIQTVLGCQHDEPVGECPIAIFSQNVGTLEECSEWIGLSDG